MSNTSSAPSGTPTIGFAGALTIAFIVLKLMNVITWSWWWILSPLWIPIVIILVFYAVVFFLVTSKK
jgi:glucan phosphoethanolaminetransferase (alkaline phosphatase superfamily)